MIQSVSIAAIWWLLSPFLTSGNNSVTSDYIVQSALPMTEFVREAEWTFGPGSAEVIYEPLGIFRVEIPLESRADAMRILEKWRKEGWCTHFQRDAKVDIRSTVPDDPLFGEQWDIERIDCPDAWDITTGGVTSRGDTIVVAVLDSGFDLDHSDLAPNSWVNHGEIPGDLIDNDNNGYTDDYRGYNTVSENDEHPIDAHGASVSGIIGARGNNARGVTGVNWHVQIMPVSGIANESQVIEAYQYVRKMRQLWNETNGARGAFVVATNLSAGISNEFPEAHPMWCAVYDDLGSIGILNVTSVTNDETNVDEEGDIPTTCRSSFLLTVTNTNRDDIRVQPSGYGKVNVDLGAPGSGTFTTTPNNNYGVFGGTSGAAPHVAGTVGLMYAVDCPDIMPLVLSDPPAAAVRMKSAILQTVNPLGSLENTTASGGRLETGAAVATICAYFTPEIRVLEVTSAYPNPTRDEITIEFVPGSLTKHYVEVFDVTGRLVFEEEIYPPANPARHTLSIYGQVAGIYIAVISSGGQSASVRFALM